MRRFVPLLVLLSLGLALRLEAATEMWFFTDGKNRGRVVVADALTHAVSPAQNPYSEASGQIAVGSFSDCKGPAHYHGTWHGKSDPHPNTCGWGHVVKVDPTTTEGAILEHIANAVLDADRVADHQRRSELGCFSDEVNQSLSDGLNELSLAQSGLDGLAPGGGLSTKLIALMIACVQKAQARFAKLQALIVSFLLSPPKTTEELELFCKQYKKRLKKLQQSFDCFGKNWAKAFL